MTNPLVWLFVKPMRRMAWRVIWLLNSKSVSLERVRILPRGVTGSVSLALALLAATFSFGCQGKEGCLPPDKLFPSSQPSLPQTGVSQKLTEQVFIDGSLSMEGFVTPKAVTAYQQFIQDLQTSFVAAWPESDVKFYKFGEIVKPVPPERGYTEVNSPGFYRDPEVYKKTHVEKVFAAIEPNALAVIVTDLFQTNADVAELVKSLSHRALESGSTVEVIAMRSEFAGTIYDWGQRSLKFRYQTRAEQKSGWRPFYALIVGRQPDVTRYLATLKRSSSPVGTGAKVLVLSRDIVSEPIGWQNARIVDLEHAVMTTSLLRGESTNSAGTFLLRNYKDATIDAILPYGVIEYAPALDLPAAVLTVSAKRCRATDTESSQAAPTTGAAAGSVGDERLVTSIRVSPLAAVSEDSKLSGGVDPGEQKHITDWLKKNPGQKAALLQVALDENPLGAPGTYAFKLEYRLGQGGYALPSWCKEWSAAPEAAPDGSKTFNLDTFLSGLQEALVSLHPPVIGQIYLYFDKPN